MTTTLEEDIYHALAECEECNQRRRRGWRTKGWFYTFDRRKMEYIAHCPRCHSEFASEEIAHRRLPCDHTGDDL